MQKSILLLWALLLLMPGLLSAQDNGVKIGEFNSDNEPVLTISGAILKTAFEAEYPDWEFDEEFVIDGDDTWTYYLVGSASEIAGNGHMSTSLQLAAAEDQSGNNIIVSVYAYFTGAICKSTCPPSFCVAKGDDCTMTCATSDCDKTSSSNGSGGGGTSWWGSMDDSLISIRNVSW